jgi:hypothetical protein
VPPDTTEIERLEALAFVSALNSLPRATTETLGIEVLSYGAATGLRTRAVDDLTVNRVIGLGLSSPMNPLELDQIVDDYAVAGVARVTVHVTPEVQPADAEGMLTARGFRRVRSNVKLCRWTSSAFATTTSGSGLEVRELEQPTDEFADIVAMELGVPDALREVVVSSIGHSGWHHYLVYDGDRPIAGAALFTHGRGAWCGFAATCPGDRRRGAQTALLHRRVADAARHGCEWISADTVAERPGERNRSLHNMRRAGFELIYDRANWVKHY